jgi:hypothetical protein
MRLYTTIEIANMTGITRQNLAKKCKKYNIKMYGTKYQLSIHQWASIVSRKHRETLFNFILKLNPVEYVPVFQDVVKVTETYYIYESKGNFLTLEQL